MPKTSFTLKYRLLVILLVIMGISLSSSAVEVADLYLVKWPVKDQNKSARLKATLAGFKEVLIRKSGSKDILEDAGVQRAYRKIIDYLQRFEYVRINDPDTKYPYSISLYFEPRLIDAIIRDAKMPLWGANRPLTVLWLAVEEGNQRQILSAISGDGLLQVVESNAVRRGLPLITPLMDLEDELAVTTSDVWGRFSSSIIQASQRYFSDSLLVGRLQAIGENWQGQFSYVNQNQEMAFETLALTKADAIALMVDKLAALLCNKYCVVEEVGENNEALLYLSGISSFTDFKAAEKYLESLSAIRKLSLVSINQQTLEIRIALLGNLESLIEGISLSNLMSVGSPKNGTRSSAQSEPESIASDLEVTDPELEQSIITATELEKQTIEKLDTETLGAEKIGIETEDAETGESTTTSARKLPRLYYRWNG